MFFFFFSGAVLYSRLYSCYSHLSSFCNLITLSEKMQGCNRMTFMSDDMCKIPCRIRSSEQFFFTSIIMWVCWTPQCALLSCWHSEGNISGHLLHCFMLFCQCFAYCNCSDVSYIWFNSLTVPGENWCRGYNHEVHHYSKSVITSLICSLLI